MTTISQGLIGVNNLLTWKTISSGSITSPVAYLDLELPTGYSLFQIELIDLAPMSLSVGVALSAALSPDGGTTFWADPTNYDTNINDFLGTGQYTNQLFHDSVIYVSSDAVSSQDVTATIFPGDDSQTWRWRNNSIGLAPVIVGQSTSPAYTVYSTGGATLNPAASIPPVYARANLVRFTPYGNGDVNPPTSGFTFIRGTYILRGII